IVRELELLRDRGALRRIAGILRHRAAGFSANGMAVWDVPDERVGEVGEAFASYSAISHCYQRPRYDDWPYSIFTMIHARCQEDCEAFVQELASTHGVETFTVLYSTTEYKKVRPVYFSPDVAAWERENGIPYPAAG
ncbi:MAG: Lrp/AsnC family transcriptional regulator, partial [Chloroflexi bacterium]|nr:Lrp/AsnC family transcriptional regulator [Chloroflexota bacterium]